MQTLRDELQLKIDDFGEPPELKEAVWNYFWYMKDYMSVSGSPSFVHTVSFF